jgi:hypothetical protein
MDFGVSIPVHDLHDRLTERRLVIKLPFTIEVKTEDIIIEVTVPETALENFALHLAPNKFVLTADMREKGIRVCQVIDLPLKITPDGVDAEQLHNTVRIAAALALVGDEPAEGHTVDI